MSPMWIWVLVCLQGNCECERIAYLHTEKELIISSPRIELNLKKYSWEGKYHVMRHDTSFYYVEETTDNGLYLVINHLEGGRRNIIKNPRPVRNVVRINSDAECFRLSNKDSN